jgi:hypothetical protein
MNEVDAGGDHATRMSVRHDDNEPGRRRKDYSMQMEGRRWTLSATSWSILGLATAGLTSLSSPQLATLKVVLFLFLKEQMKASPSWHAAGRG